MLRSDDFIPDEWEAITSLPLRAGILVMWSHGTNPLEFLSEVSTLTTTIIDATDSKNPLIGAVARHHQAQEENFQVEVPETQEAAEQFRLEVLDQCYTVSTLLASKSSPDVTGVFKQWVVGVARRVAESAKEGSLLGVFGDDVSEYEREIIEQLNDALGLPKH